MDEPFEARCVACKMLIGDIRREGVVKMLAKTGHNLEHRDGQWALSCSRERRRRANDMD